MASGAPQTELGEEIQRLCEERLGLLWAEAGDAAQDAFKPKGNQV